MEFLLFRTISESRGFQRTDLERSRLPPRTVDPDRRFWGGSEIEVVLSVHLLTVVSYSEPNCHSWVVGMDSTLRALSAQANSGGNSGAPEPLLAMLSSLSRNVQLNRGVESAMPSAHATSASAFSAEAKAGESSTEADSPLSLFRQDAVPAMTLFQATSGKGDKSLANATRDELVDALGRRALQDAPAEALLDALAAKSDQELQSIQERIQALLSRISGPIKGHRAMKQTEFMESSAGQADFLLAGATTQHKTAVRSEEESPLLYLLDDRLLARLWPRTRLMVGIRSSRRLRVVLTAASSFALVVTAVESCAGEKEESPAKTAEMRASWLATLGGDVEMSARTASDAQQLLSVLGSQVCGNRMKMKVTSLASFWCLRLLSRAHSVRCSARGSAAPLPRVSDSKKVSPCWRF